MIDFPATVFDITGIDPDYDMFGLSLLPLIAGETDSHRDAVFCEGGRRIGEDQAMEKASPSFSDPSELYYPRVELQGREDGSHSKATMCRTQNFKYVRRLYELDELYDLQADPTELRNVIEDPRYVSVLALLRDRMLEWYHETSDVIPYQTDQRS